MDVLFIFLMEGEKYAECIQEWATEEGTCFYWGQVAGGWNRLHIEQIPDLHTH
jgi:hypothetical protein